jgi:hypothetical protein
LQAARASESARTTGVIRRLWRMGVSVREIFVITRFLVLTSI